MIIDFHTHIGETVGKQKEHLLVSMDEAEIDKSVIYAGAAMKLSNEEVLKCVRSHPDRFMGALYGNPWIVADGAFKEHLKQFEDQLEDPGVVGIKFYSGYEYYYAHNEYLVEYYNLLKKHNKVAIFHCGDTYTVLNSAKLKYAHPIHLDEVAVDHPDLKIVIAHLAYPWHRDAAQLLYKNKNVYADVSGFVYGEFNDTDKKNFTKVFEEVQFIYDNGWDRVLFGTDWPISNQTSYREVLDEIVDQHGWNLLDLFQNNTEKLISSLGKK
jgi:predicted TIM-barrel fold metal-dependent hydrolase